PPGFRLILTLRWGFLSQTDFSASHAEVRRIPKDYSDRQLFGPIDFVRAGSRLCIARSERGAHRLKCHGKGHCAVQWRAAAFVHPLECSRGNHLSQKALRPRAPPRDPELDCAVNDWVSPGV